MSIQIRCKNCDSKLKAPDSAIGRKAKCPKCKSLLVISDDHIRKDMLVPKTDVSKVVVRRPIPCNKKCPYCSEEVLVTAKKCKHCGEILDAALRSAEEARRSAAEKQSPMVFMNAASSASPVNSAGNETIIKGEKNKVAAALFAFFLGAFGFHKFYLGQVAQGVLYLLFFWTFIPGIIAFFEGINYLSMNDHRFARIYI